MARNRWFKRTRWPLPLQYDPGMHFGVKGVHWTACGFHTGTDFPAPVGTPVYATIKGTVRHRNYGSAFGNHQVAVSGRGRGEYFYAHMRARVADGTRVKPGDKIGEVGVEGNSFGPHLHFEHHTRKNAWSCGVLSDPLALLHRNEVYVSKLHRGQSGSNSVKQLQRRLNQIGGRKHRIKVDGHFGATTAARVRHFQHHIKARPDKAGHESIGWHQAHRLFNTKQTLLHH